MALLEPSKRLKEAEREGDYTTRLVLFEQALALPWQAVWEEFCRREEVPGETGLLQAVKDYEAGVLAKRD